MLFAGYELVEIRWLSDLSARELHALHRMRGVGFSLLSAILAAWLILRTSPQLLDSPPPADAGPRDRLAHKLEQRQRYARWFIRMRWMAIVVAATLTFVAVGLLGMLPDDTVPPLLGLIGVLAALNIVYGVLASRDHPPPWLLELQAYADLVVLTMLLHYSGGVENPLAPVMLIHVIIAGIIVSRRQCYLVATAATLLFAVMAAAEWSDAVDHYTLTAFPHEVHEGEVLHAAHYGPYVVSRVALHGALLFLTAYFATTLAARIRDDEREMEKLAGRLATQSQMLEQALETTGTGLRMSDRDLNPVWVNLRWSGLGTRTADALGPAARQAVADGKVRVTELALGDGGARAAPDRTIVAGSTRVYRVTTAPLVDAAGAVSHVAELAQDITEQKRAERMMMRAERLAAVGELAGKVAHEVNNPIAVISAKSRLLLADDHGLSERTAGEIAKIVDLADRVARIAQGLLSYGRPSPAIRTRIDPHGPVRRALAYVAHAAEAQCVKLEDRLPPGLPEVEGNAGELEQVFLNLFLNALDAMPKGGALVVEASASDGRIAIAVEDSGCGIPAELKERVFEPFWSTKAEGKGTGLGLAICSGLVRSHGGQIECDSTPGQGTRFTITLPVAHA